MAFLRGPNLPILYFTLTQQKTPLILLGSLMTCKFLQRIVAPVFMLNQYRSYFPLNFGQMMAGRLAIEWARGREYLLWMILAPIILLICPAFRQQKCLL